MSCTNNNAIYQGEQEYIEIRGIDYDAFEQIYLLFYSNYNSTKIEFVKVADELYPNAELIEKREEGMFLFFTKEKTLSLPSGGYMAEIKVITGGETILIYKDVKPAFSVKLSKTN